MTNASGSLLPNQEIELKLTLEAHQITAFKRLMARRRVTPTTHNLHTRYFDTPEFALGDLGIALRIRRVGRRWIQTLKKAGESQSGLSTRAEYESPVPGNTLDFSRLPTEAVVHIPPSLIKQLVPMFETRFTRTAWLIRNRSGTAIEVALDVGEIRAGTRVQALCEVELELKSGRAEALLEWALALTEQIDLLPFDLSKAERGMQLARGVDVRPARARALKLSRNMTVEDGFAAICRACLAQFQANLPGLLRVGDPEYLHQARVALRRLRAALRLFRRVCPLTLSELQQSLRSWGAVMGPARDWDVLCLETLPAIAPHFADAQAWAHFAEAAEAQRKNARQAMRVALTETHPGRVLLQFQRWLARKDWRQQTAPDDTADKRGAHQTERLAQLQALPDFAAQALRRGQRKVRRMAQDFAQLAPDARHELRILIKRQRYAAEFFKSLQPHSKDKPYLQALVITQDGLGRANDAHVATVLLNTLPDAHDKQVAAFVEGWLAHTAVQTADPGFERALAKLV